jgi:hypothetical protein
MKYAIFQNPGPTSRLLRIGFVLLAVAAGGIIGFSSMGPAPVCHSELNQEEPLNEREITDEAMTRRLRNLRRTVQVTFLFDSSSTLRGGKGKGYHSLSNTITSPIQNVFQLISFQRLYRINGIGRPLLN